MNLKISQFPIVRTRLVILALATLFVLVMASIFVRDAFAQSAEPAAGQHVITLHDSGEEVGFLTDKHTLREALADAEIAIGENDLTEPGLDEELTAATYEVNIYRARPVNVIDGSTQLKVMTPYRTANQIAEQAGIALHDEDTAVLDKVDDVLAEGAVEQLTIDRATAVKLVFYGKESTAYTQATTVGEMLKEKNVTLGDADKMSVTKDTKITTDMKVEIWREGKQTVTREEVIEKPVRKVMDSDKPIGYEEVQTAGADGTRDVTYEINIVNGAEVSRTEISSITTKEPTEEVVVVGTKNTGTGLTKAMGVKMFTDSNGVVHRETYYDLDMSVVMTMCGAGGQYTVREDGVKVDPAGYIIIAANLAKYPRCSVVETSLGQAKVYDTGGFAAVHPDGYDIATDWTNYNGV